MFEKLGVIGDIHGNASALEAVLRDAQQRGVSLGHRCPRYLKRMAGTTKLEPAASAVTV